MSSPTSEDFIEEYMQEEIDNYINEQSIYDDINELIEDLSADLEILNDGQSKYSLYEFYKPSLQRFIRDRGYLSDEDRSKLDSLLEQMNYIIV